MNLESIKPNKPSNFFEQKIKNEWNDIRPDFEDFEDLIGEIYTKKEFNRDKKKTKEKATKIGAISEFSRSGDYELAEDFEYSLMEAIQNFEWFGEQASISPASHFDDFFRGTDFILAFKEGEDKYKYLAIDATISQQKEDITEKEGRIYKNLDNGRMTEVKYFINDEDSDIRGRFKMPHAVVAFNPTAALEFKNILSKGRNLSFDDKKELMAIKNDIIVEIKAQLGQYIKHLDIGIKSKKGLADRRSLRVKKGQEEALKEYQNILNKF